MANQAPQIDSRTAIEIAEQVQTLLGFYAPGWQEAFDPCTREPKSVSAALLGIFGRYAEIIIQRLNQVPDKNLLAFLDLLGASLLPPQPARVPLTFSLAAGSASDAVVPAGTQVAAPPAKGEEKSVIFETERELVVTAAQLASIWSRDPNLDAYADYSAIIAAASSGAPVFRGNRRIEHTFYLGHDTLFGYPALEKLHLSFDLESDPTELSDDRDLQWEIWDGAQGDPITPSSDGTENLTKDDEDLVFSDLSQFPQQTVDKYRSRWLRCRLLTPITPEDEPHAGMVRASQLPSITSVKMTATLGRSGLAVEKAFANLLQVDLGKDFFPFGEKPKFGDTLYLANGEAFSVAEGVITLKVTLTGPDSGIPPVQASSDLELDWEFWNGTSWAKIGTSTPQGGQDQFIDTTEALTKDGYLTFTLPGTPAATTVNGVEDFWIRVRIVAGNYGQEARYELVTTPHLLFSTAPGEYPAELDKGIVSEGLRNEFTDKGGIVLSQNVIVATKEQGSSWLLIDQDTKVYTLKVESGALNVYLQSEGYHFIPATFAPPSISSVEVSYTLTKENVSPEEIVTYNDFKYARSENDYDSFVPFEPTEDEYPSLYLGFTLPPSRATFPNRTLSLFGRVADFKYGHKLVPISPDCSKETGDPNTVVEHLFSITNDSSQQASFELAILGTHWVTSEVPQQLGLDAGESKEVEIRVTIPPEVLVGDSDRGFLRLVKTDDPSLEYSATFVTFVGTEPSLDERLGLDWQYSKGTAWSHLTVRDDTENWTRSGLVEFLVPADISPRSEFGLSRYWLRVRWQSGDYKIEPRLRRMLLNTTMAAQTVTIGNEILGSSDGSENQSFQTTCAPVLLGQQLEVREPEMPPADEQAMIKKEEGKDAISLTLDKASGRPREIWVRWHQVPDFYGSGPRDRHYVLDQLSGEVRFGNGLNGLIPPVTGSGNIRLTHYQTGGGASGNKSASDVIQLKTTVPYVDKVTNTEAASGGADAESLASLLERAPRTIRHRGRAVTLEDYEDLALSASPRVARARCVPLYDLVADPDATQLQPGTVSLIVIPRSTASKPLPSLELIERVQDHIKANRLPNAKVVVLGPEYIRVEVEAEIALASLEGASEVESAIVQALCSFLHPLTGGADGAGWDFGRKPHRSDLYALLEAVAGVDHVRVLETREFEERAGAGETGRFLVYSGTHTIRLSFEG